MQSRACDAPYIVNQSLPLLLTPYAQYLPVSEKEVAESEAVPSFDKRFGSKNSSPMGPSSVSETVSGILSLCMR